MPRKMMEWRAKLYQLEHGGAWIDKGTGLVACIRVSERTFLLAFGLEIVFLLLPTPIGAK
jgi:hypothetical protein